MREVLALAGEVLLICVVFAVSSIGSRLAMQEIGTIRVEVIQAPGNIDLRFPKNGMLVMPQHPLVTFRLHFSWHK